MDHSILTHSVDQLADINTLSRLFDKDTRVFRMPSEHVLGEIINIARDIIFPYHYGETPVYSDTLKYYIGVRVDRLSRLLREQIAISLEYDEEYCANCHQRAEEITSQFIGSLPSLRAILTTDVVAAYNGDPAAKRALRPSAVAAWRSAYPAYSDRDGTFGDGNRHPSGCDHW